MFISLTHNNNKITKTNIMKTTKAHLAMAMGQGKITLHKSACGLGDFNRTRLNHIIKTSTFKILYQERGTELICEKCLAKAKEQGRV